MALDHIFYSSLTLGITGGLAIVLAILFRLKNRNLGKLPENLSPNIFNKTFAVFDPFPEQKKSIHRLLVALPFIGFFATFGLIAVAWRMLESGLILSLFIIIISINMILVEEAPEVYINSRIFLKAIKNRAELAAGDLKALQLIKTAARKLSNYYFGLAILLIACAITFPYITTLPMQLFVLFLDLIVQAGGWAGIIGWQITILLLAMSFVILQIIAIRIKNRIFKYRLE